MGGDEPVSFPDPGADQHGIAFLDDRLCRFPDVLRQREDHFSLCVKDAQRRFPTQLFVLLRMNAAAKRVSHD